MKGEGDDGKRYKRERLGRAGKALVALCDAGTLLTCLDEGLTQEGPAPSMPNKIENPNGRIGRVPSRHRGMNVDHGIEAVLWFCCMASEAPLPFARMLRGFPSDKCIRRWGGEEAAKQQGGETGEPARWGEGVAWSELRQSTPYPYRIDQTPLRTFWPICPNRFAIMCRFLAVA